MQDREPTYRNYFLYVSQDYKTPVSVYNQLPSTLINNGVIVYRDLDDRSSSSSGEHAYKACFVINNILLIENGELLQVPMGNRVLRDRGMIPEEADNYAALINMALMQLNREDMQVPKLIIERLALNDMQRMLHESEAPRVENARRLNAEKEKKEKDEQENVIIDAAIFHLIASDPEPVEKETKSHTLEHKDPESAPGKAHDDVNHNPNVVEVAPYILPRVLENIAFDYIENFDSTTEKETEGHDVINLPAEHKYAQLSLFGRPFLNLEQTATELGEMIRRGEENEIEYVLSQVKKYPAFLDVKVTTKGPQNIVLEEKTLLEIAFMEGDVDLKEGITDEKEHAKEHGMVERLALAGELSKERVAEHLQRVTSGVAKDENEARIKRYADIMIKFGGSICDGQIKDDAIKQLEEDLVDERKNHPVSVGLVFDPRILQEAAQWFEKNVDKRFGDWWSDKSNIFWINGFGKLQSMLSARDAQVIRAGIANLVDDGVIPPRTLKNSDNTSYFYNSNSRLGRDFYLGIYAARGGPRAAPLRGAYSNLMSSKNSSIAKLCNIQTSPRSMHA